MIPKAEPCTPSIVRGAGLFYRIDYRLIETPEEKDELYLMRYRAYLHGGLILPSASGRVSDRYDDAPNAWIFGIYVDGELCSSLRLHVLTSDARMSYATELFGDVLHSRLDKGEVFIDPARFVADPDKARRFPELPYLSLRLAYLACEYFNADTGLAVVRAEHQAFSRRVFLHETIAEPRSFPNVLKKVPLGHPRVVLTPHSAFYSVEAERELRRKAAQNLSTWLAKGRPEYVVSAGTRAPPC